VSPSESRARREAGNSRGERGGGRLATAHSAQLKTMGSIGRVADSLYLLLRTTPGSFQPSPPPPPLPSFDTILCRSTLAERTVVACGGREELPHVLHEVSSSSERIECVFPSFLPSLSLLPALPDRLCAPDVVLSSGHPHEVSAYSNGIVCALHAPHSLANPLFPPSFPVLMLCSSYPFDLSSSRTRSSPAFSARTTSSPGAIGFNSAFR
jgi:hypothetical protein